MSSKELVFGFWVCFVIVVVSRCRFGQKLGRKCYSIRTGELADHHVESIERFSHEMEITRFEAVIVLRIKYPEAGPWALGNQDYPLKSGLGLLVTNSGVFGLAELVHLNFKKYKSIY